jgi:hypothetical protein
MFESSMKQQAVYQKFGELTLVRDTFAYDFDSEEWEQYMERIGCTRLPDQIVELPKEKTYRELIAEMSEPADDENDQTVN